MAATPTPTGSPQVDDQDGRSRPNVRRNDHIGWIVAGSLAAGLLAALLLAAAPFIATEENAITGALLCGFALGWALLAVLSVRFTEHPQRWAAIPALFMAVGGLLLIWFGTPLREIVNWVWPPALLALVVWMVIRARRQLPARSQRWLLYPVLAVLGLAAIGGGYETVREAADATAYPIPGRLIDVGGHRLHLHCTGSGSPTVILEPGAGDFSSAMGWITPAVAEDTRVCVYDRAGRGWSEPADGPQDGTQIASDLHTLLQRGNVPGPYVPAGHSFGGLYVLTYAARYPDEVAGMVLVDSTNPASKPPAQGASTDDTDSYDAMGRISALGAASARVGLARLVGYFGYDSLPSRSRDEVRAGSATANYVGSYIDEYVQGNASVAEAASLTDFGGKPLIVLTAGVGSDAAHSASQDHLATLSGNSVHRVIDGASHADLILEKKYAAATTEAILDVVSAARGRE